MFTFYPILTVRLQSFVSPCVYGNIIVFTSIFHKYNKIIFTFSCQQKTLGAQGAPMLLEQVRASPSKSAICKSRCLKGEWLDGMMNNYS